MTESKTTLKVKELDCVAEEDLIRKRLRSLPEVSELGFNVVAREVSFRHPPGLEAEVMTAIRSLGMTVSMKGDGAELPAANCEDGSCAPRLTETKSSRMREYILLGISGAFAISAEVTAWVTGNEKSIAVLALALGALALGGLPTLRKGWIALRNFTLNINLLMTIAVIGAFAIGEYPEAAMVVFLFAVAELIERYSLDRARNAVQALMEMAPEQANLKQADGAWKDVPAAEVKSGSTVRVRPGERVPLDGIVTVGNSAVDQAPITGESIPVEKVVGDKLFAGTVNGNGVLEFQTTGGKDETTIARIIQTVQEAQNQRAPTQRFVDSFARVYTPIVVVLAVLVVLVPWLLFSQPFLPWLYKALVLLVIACPCALVISTPVTIVSGLAFAAKQGLLIKGGVYLEEGRKLRVVALDKTGTITEGRPVLTDVIPLGGQTSDEVKRLAASVDAGSDHPVARAVTTAWTSELQQTTDQKSLTGRGVEARIDGKMFTVGNHRLAEERGVCSAEVEKHLEAFEAEGKTAIILADEKEALAVMAVADTPRQTSIEAIRELHTLGVRTLMLSGDNQRTADAVARAVGIDEARGSLLPEDKLTAMDELIKKYDFVGMVGDGINDAPALAKANIGFAMGAAGTDTALETADVALMRDDLRALPLFIRLSKKTATVLKQNISFAIGTKVVFFVLALLGIAGLWLAVIADMGASLVVVLNGLRLLRGSQAKS